MRLAAAIALIALAGGRCPQAESSSLGAAVEMTEPYVELAACRRGLTLSPIEVRSFAEAIAERYVGIIETPELVAAIRRDADIVVRAYAERKP